MLGIDSIKRFLKPFFSSFAIRKVRPGSCHTRYPIILVHGILYRDDMFIASWGRIPDYLRRGGARVFLSQVDGWGSYKDNAQMLKDRIDEVLVETKAQKVNLIAHSKGGIDSRYAITKLGLGDKVASLTTVCTPHRGSCIADIINKKIIPDEQNSVYHILDFFVKLLGDKSPDSRRSSRELSMEHMKSFNDEVPDEPGVYYQSYGAQIFHRWNDPVFALTFNEIKKLEGDNDGMVSVASSQWGEFKGVVKGNRKGRGISHLQITGSVGDIFAGVNIPLRYVSWVEALKHQGF